MAFGSVVAKVDLGQQEEGERVEGVDSISTHHSGPSPLLAIVPWCPLLFYDPVDICCSWELCSDLPRGEGKCAIFGTITDS